MAISDKLNYLIETKQLFKDRLNSLGAEITSSTAFRNYLTWLDTFYGEVSNKTDLSQNGVVGRTSQESTTGKNLLSSIGLTTQTIDGVTFTPVYENNLLQYIQANGTATNGINYYIQNNYTLNETGTFYITDGIGVTGGENNNTFFIYCGLGASGRTDTNNGQFTVSDASIKSDIRIVVRSGVALNNIKFYPMISKVINDTYEPYTGGQPSPSSDYPQPINNLSEDVAYKVSGKNLLNKADGTYDGWVTIDITDLIEDGVNYYTSVDYKNLIGSCTMRIDYTYNGTINYIWGQGGSDGTVAEGTMNKLFSIPNHDQNTNIYLRIKDNMTGLTSGYYSNWLLAKSDTATSYEPYIESQTFNIPLGDIELCKIDTYEDKIYSSNGRFYLNKNIGKVLLNGSEIWSSTATNTTGYNRFMVNFGQNIITTDTSTIAPFVSDKFVGVSRGDTFLRKNGLSASNDTYSYKSITLYYEEVATMSIDDFKNWLSSNNVLVYYPYATPTTTEITQENYPSLYNALKQIQDYLTAYKINKEFILGYSSPEIEY